MKLPIWLLRLWRLSVLVIAVYLIRSQSAEVTRPAPLGLDDARQWFPAAAKITQPDGETGAQYVTDQFGDALGFLMQTLPGGRDIIGYSGPSNTLLALDRQGKLIGAKLISSGDTTDHVRRVVDDPGYWDRLLGLTDDPGPIRGVSGATLTSTAITRGILRALGAAEQTSLLFPYPLETGEVRKLYPTAASIEPDPSPLGGVLVLDAKGTLLGRVLRTSPASDPVIGYKGPTDTMIALDPEGARIRELRVRDSYETEEYLAIATKDSRFLPAFSGRSVEAMQAFDFQSEGVSGVSGATRSSLAILEGVRRRLNQAKRSSAPMVQLGLRDVALVAIVAFAVVLTFTQMRGIRWLRWVWNAILIGYLGLIAGDMVSQALLAGWAANGLPWRDLPGLVALTAAALLVPLFTGKQLYCHHLCPHGAAQQWVGRLTKKKVVIPARLGQWLSRIPFVLLGSIFLLVLAGAGVNLAALEPFDAWIFRASGLASIILAVAGLIAALFHPLAYCKFGCPTGALLRFLRTGESQDRLAMKDWIALSLLGVGSAMTLFT